MSRNSLPYRIVLLAAVITVGCDHEPTGPSPARPAHIVVTAPNGFTQVSAGQAHTCALRTDGVAECWGLTNAVNSGQAPPTRAPASGSFTQIGVGRNHSCALRNDGVVECWGANYGGEAPPVRAAATGQFVQLAVGAYHTCALRTDGTIECWGVSGSTSYLDHGQAPPARTATTGTYTQVSAGTSHTCARRNDGVIECWGWSSNGPASQAAASSSFAYVAAGQDHTCALRADGVLECFGYNGQGQAPPLRAAASGVFAQVAAGGGHTCARRNDGVVECFGENFEGQAPATRNAGVGSFSSVSAGQVHTCAVRTDGVVECWGYNGHDAAPAIRVAAGVYNMHLLPTASFSASPAPVVLGQPFTLSLDNAQVAGYSGSVTFSYAFDCGDGTGYSAFGPSNSAICTTSSVGNRTAKGIVRDQDGDQTEYNASVGVIYPFSGFIGSIDAPPTFNVVKAGAAVPAKFNLGGNQGLAILAAGYPKSQPIQCNASSPADPIEETVSAGNSSLTYDASSGQYTYIWKTEKAWANSCRLMTLRLADGAEYTALFQFTR